MWRLTDWNVYAGGITKLTADWVNNSNQPLMFVLADSKVDGGVPLNAYQGSQSPQWISNVLLIPLHL